MKLRGFVFLRIVGVVLIIALVYLHHRFAGLLFWQENENNGSMFTSNDVPNFTQNSRSEQRLLDLDGKEKETLTNSRAQNHPNKIILWYVKTRYQPLMIDLEKLQHCPDMNCRMTSNRKYLNISSAVLFAAQLIRERYPPRKIPGQVWIFHNHESPLDRWSSLPTFRLPQWKGMFNWTMDYRREADIVSPYGILKKVQAPTKRNYTDIVLNKKGLVSWMVSNCHTEGKREQYVHKLQKHLQVATFGNCGGTSCPRYNQKECLTNLDKYKFYLSFENAFCPDYITEKFFLYYSIDVVPVVRGGGNYSKTIPYGTYINTADFQSVDALARYLVYLDKNNDKYMEYLKRKDLYHSIFEAYHKKNKNGEIHYVHYHYEHTPFCELCRRLWYLDNYTKTYSDIGVWFDQGRCYQPPDIGLYKF